MGGPIIPPMPAVDSPMNTKDLLLQTSPGRTPHPLELFVRLEGSDEFHFYTQGLTMADFGAIFGLELKPLDVFVTRMPSDLLNPNYWEPLSKEAENAVREKLGGIITRTEGDKALLFRADRVSRGRLLRDGLDVPVELLNGSIFRVSGDGLLKLGQAWSGRGRFEWAGLAGLPKGALPGETLSTVHHDLAQARLSLREELIPLAEGIGISADPIRDIVNTGRTVEVTLWLGRTPWGVSPRPGREAMLAKERALLYYDSISGLWDVAS